MSKNEKLFIQVEGSDHYPHNHRIRVVDEAGNEHGWLAEVTGYSYHMPREGAPNVMVAFLCPTFNVNHNSVFGPDYGG